METPGAFLLQFPPLPPPLPASAAGVRPIASTRKTIDATWATRFCFICGFLSLGGVRTRSRFVLRMDSRSRRRRLARAGGGVAAEGSASRGRQPDGIRGLAHEALEVNRSAG